MHGALLRFDDVGLTAIPVGPDRAQRRCSPPRTARIATMPGAEKKGPSRTWDGSPGRFVKMKVGGRRGTRCRRLAPKVKSGQCLAEKFFRDENIALLTLRYGNTV